MKNKKMLSLLVIVLLGTLALTACDGVLPGDLNLEEYLQDRTTLNSNIVNAMPDDSDKNKDDDLNNSSDDEMISYANDNSSSSEHGPEVEIKGEITAVTANSLTIHGETFTVETIEDLTTLFTAGEIFEIEYEINSDGSITLLEFELEDDMDDDMDDDTSSSEHGPEVEIKGEITAVTANSITINGETFTVETIEDLTTLFTAGEIFEIEYEINSDGTITLLEFELEDDMDDDSDDDMEDDSNDDSDDDMNDDSDDDENNNSDDHDSNDNNDDDNDDNDDENNS